MKPVPFARSQPLSYVLTIGFGWQRLAGVVTMGVTEAASCYNVVLCILASVAARMKVLRCRSQPVQSSVVKGEAFSKFVRITLPHWLLAVVAQAVLSRKFFDASFRNLIHENSILIFIKTVAQRPDGRPLVGSECLRWTVFSPPRCPHARH